MAWLGTSSIVLAQESTLEFWPEIDAWLRLTPAWRLSMFVPIAKNIETHYREGNLVLQGDYAFGKMNRRHMTRLMDENRAQQMKRFMIRSGYLGGKSLGDNGAEYTELAMLAEFHVRTPIKGGILLTHRVRSDLRWLGDDHEFSSRLRYRLQVEKEWTAGTSVAWSPRFAIEGNWTYQHDTRSSVETTNAFNLILHLFFETRHAK
jgi:hypothetical protein